MEDDEEIILRYENEIKNYFFKLSISKNIERKDSFSKELKNPQKKRTGIDLTSHDLEILDRIGKPLGNTRPKQIGRVLEILEYLIIHDKIEY